MLSLSFPAVALLTALVPTALAQTFTACNPLNTTGCPDMPALGANATFNFNDTLHPKLWTKKNHGEVDIKGNKGATFQVEARGDSPQIVSNFYILFGRLEVKMKAAHGQGIVSSAILQSECLDEIDWEFLGSKPEVMTNYFGKGNMIDGAHRGKDFNMTTKPQDDFHNYTLDWTKDRIQWWVDGQMLRELKNDDAVIPDKNHYPQTPMNVRIGIWAGGDVENNNKGTVEWAGGETNFKDGPFVMTVQDVYVQDYTSAKTYSWEGMDASGSWEKVKVIEGKSEAIEEIEKPSGVKERYKALSHTGKIAIAASILGTAVIVACVIIFCCIKQRRAGRRQAAAYEAQALKEGSFPTEYQGQGQQMGTGSGLTGSGYNRI